MGTFRVCSLFASVLVLIAASYGQDTSDYLLVRSEFSDFSWINPIGRSLRLRVKSEDPNTHQLKEASVVISPQPFLNYMGAPTYELTLEFNFHGAIYSGLSRGNLLMKTTYEKILTPQKFVDIWVSWADGIFSAGRGLIIGQDTLMSYTDPNPLDVWAVGFGAPHRDAYFEVSQYDVLSMYFMTSYSSPTWISKKTSKNIVFGAKASSDVVIALSAKYDSMSINTDMYLRIGGNGNTKSTISDNMNNILSEENTPDILSPKEYSYFWVSWTELSIKVGKGTQVGNNQFMMYSQVPGGVQWDDFEAVNLYSNLNGIYYFVHNTPGNHFLVQTKTKSQHHLSIGHQTVFVFRARGCQAAVLGFTRSGDTQEYLKVVIGTGDEQKNVEIHTTDGIKVFSTDYQFKCAYFVQMWFSWRQGLYELGRGSVPYVDTMLSWQDPSQTADFVDLYLDCFVAGGSIEWQFDKNSGSEINIDSTVNEAWLTVYGQTSLFFGVKACSDARIQLAQWMKMGSENSFTIILGDQDKTMIAKNDVIIQETSTETINILDCNEINHFWIDWKGEIISVGRGVSPGVDTIVSYDAIKDVIAISEARFYSSSAAVWQFSEASGGNYVAQTKPAAYERLEKKLRS